MYIFPMLADEGRVVDSYIDCFSSISGNVFIILAYYLEVGDIGSGMGVGQFVLVNCTSDVTVVFFDSIFQTSAGLYYVGKVTTFF